MTRRASGAIARNGVAGAAQTCLPISMCTSAKGAAYVYDGTVEGLLSAIFEAAAAHDAEADIVREGEVQLKLDQDIILIETDLSHARRIQRTLVCAHGSEAFEAVYLASLLDGPDIPLIVQRFVMFALQEQNPCRLCRKKAACCNPCQIPQFSSILEDVGNPIVWQLEKAVRSVVNERHRLLQFLRFEHRQGDAWFARCNPNASVVPLLMRHFAARFNTERFVIYDEVHGLSGIYDGHCIGYVTSDEVDAPPEMEDEIKAQDAWRRYWNSVTIAQRYNPELQRQFMPKRFWQNITEMKDVMFDAHTNPRHPKKGRLYQPAMNSAVRPSHRTEE